jgi:hypothetical protein
VEREYVKLRSPGMLYQTDVMDSSCSTEDERRETAAFILRRPLSMSQVQVKLVLYHLWCNAFAIRIGDM